MRSLPSVCTTGSATPLALTRFSMIVRIVSMSPFAGVEPSAVNAWYSPPRPPCRSSPRRVSANAGGSAPGRGNSRRTSTATASPPLAGVREREAMRLVAQALHEVQGRARGRQHDGIAAVREEQLLPLLGQACQRDVVQAQLVEDRARGAHLPLAAVDDHEVRQPPA